jgi:hypothetical protein
MMNTEPMDPAETARICEAMEAVLPKGAGFVVITMMPHPSGEGMHVGIHANMAAETVRDLCDQVAFRAPKNLRVVPVPPRGHS